MSVNVLNLYYNLVERVLSGLHWEPCLVYLDDGIVLAHDFDSPVARLEAVLNRISKAGMKISPNKCQLFRKQVEFLGHIASDEGLSTSPSKTETVDKWPSAKSVKGLRRYLGLTIGVL